MDFETKDLHQIIDDAMTKKDREVTIFISKDHTHITVSPRTDSKPRWMIVRGAGRISRLVCSECGEGSSFQSPFCPACGEKLAAPNLKEVTDEE
jgi:hypothetical protein